MSWGQSSRRKGWHCPGASLERYKNAYDSAGRLETLTYPTSTAGVRFKTKYGYAGGHLASVQEFTGDVNGAVLWTLNLLDARRNAVSEVRIPQHVGPRFHVMPGRDSTACRATVPRQAGPVEG